MGTCLWYFLQIKFDVPYSINKMVAYKYIGMLTKVWEKKVVCMILFVYNSL